MTNQQILISLATAPGTILFFLILIDVLQFRFYLITVLNTLALSGSAVVLITNYCGSMQRRRKLGVTDPDSTGTGNALQAKAATTNELENSSAAPSTSMVVVSPQQSSLE